MPLKPPVTAENIYENVPPRRRGQSMDPSKRAGGPLPPVPPPKCASALPPPMPPPKGVSVLPPMPGIAPGMPGVGITPMLPPTANPMLADQRLRGVSVDRHREYQTPMFYEDAYYTRAENDHRVTVKQIDHFPVNGRLERHSSHPNLRPRPSTAGGRRLPKTPQQPPGTIIVIENIVDPTGATPAPTGTLERRKGTGRTLPQPDVKPNRAASSAARGLTSGLGGGGGPPPSRGSRMRSTENDGRRSYSLPRRPPNPKPLVKTEKTMPKGTGRRLPSTPFDQTSGLPLHNGAEDARKQRELPKPQSLELRHSNRDYMNNSNAAMGLGMAGRSSRSMNFPRLDGSPTHSECSSESGFMRGASGRHRGLHHDHSLRGSRRKLPDY